MYQADSIEALRQHLLPARRSGQLIAFVPTMGNLHAGHLSLVEQAKKRAPIVVTSIFVNPMQFGAGEDFDRYPRTLAADAKALANSGNDVLFTPAVDEVYPLPMAEMTRIHVPTISEVLCGHFRPGHFDGVCTVVAKLFHMVQPQIACFGEKDFQQLLLIKRMVSDLNLAVQVYGCDTQRESDGLAMSSRNQYLSPAQRDLAPSLYQEMLQLRQRAQVSPVDYVALCEETKQRLHELGFEPQYVEIRNADSLLPARVGDPHIRLFVAAYLGTTRLIDNIRLSSAT